MPERIDLSRSDDLRDVVHRAVACLAQGGSVGLPTESGYGVVAGALNVPAVEKLGGIFDGSPPDSRGFPTLLLRGFDEADDWADLATEAARRLARRGWPGPLTLVLPASPDGLAGRLPDAVRPRLILGGKVALRSPSDRMLREILRLSSGPLVLIEPLAGPNLEAFSGDDLAHLDAIDMLLEVGPTRLDGPSTVVEIEPEGWSILREGVLTAPVLAQMAGTIVLFICTGNTCRSPMAEALCKALLAKRIGCETGELVDRGYVVLSAGVSASDGMPAASHAMEVVKSRGGSLRDHESRHASPELVRLADHILAMTLDHLDTLLDRNPDASPKARLLDPAGDDIADPVGSDLPTYQRTARAIESHLDRFLDELLGPSAPPGR